MDTRIEPFGPHHLDAVLRLSLRAWAPVFASLQRVMLPAVYQQFYGDDWRAVQRQAVQEVCLAADTHVWVATAAGSVVGFVAAKQHAETSMGEVYMVAVDPDYQGQGIANSLLEMALAWMKETGLTIVMVETGGDPGHAPARRTYERLGFNLLPVARYFKQL